MKCEIVLITTILLLNSLAFGQYNVKDSISVNISLANSSNDLDTTFVKLGVKFNKSAVRELYLRDVYREPGELFFKENYFKEFSSLRTLRLENGGIARFPSSTFVDWRGRFKNLSLINIGLEDLSNDLLKPIPYLTELNVSHNKLSHLANDVFNASSYLCDLDLSHNKLNNLPRDIFKPLKNLAKLNLKHNNISQLNEDTFSSQRKNLTRLDLSFNDIQYVHDEVFTGMNVLTFLKMSHAFSPKYDFAHLPPELFGSMPELWSLEADQNNFQHLPEDIFRDLVNLGELDLSSNNIISLSSKIFEKNHLLESLNLGSNQLTSLENSLFRNLTNLKYLNLANNKLTSFYRKETFISLYRLETLILDNNEGIDLAYDDSKSVLYNCYLIRHISARNINKSDIYADWQLSQSLELLDFTNTSVGKIHLNFTFQSKVAQLKLTGSSNESLILSKGQLISLNNNSSEQYILDKRKDCDRNCSCVFHLKYIERIISLECIRFDREKLEPEIPSFIKALARTFRIDFILDSCSTFDIQLLADYISQIDPEKVRTLSLSNNRLNSISELIGVFPPKLEVLKLDTNHFTRLDPDIVRKLQDNSQALQTITLHNNNWNCSCETNNFISFVKKIKDSHKIPEDTILCNDSIPIEDFDDEICGPPSNTLLLGGLGFAIFTTIFAIGWVLYGRYKFYINSYAYQYREYLPLWVFPDEEYIDSDKIYDAFLCYAADDEAFIVSRLVPMLENMAPYFKLCIHQRDWLPGCCINDQIYRSVMNSRRTLVVLSHNFLNSHWCKTEFLTARNQAIKDGVNRLIVIMLEDIAPSRLNEDLQAYITRYTYIPWQDNDWFWGKLRYALPHLRRAKTKNNQSADHRDEQSEMIAVQQC